MVVNLGGALRGAPLHTFIILHKLEQVKRFAQKGE